MEVRVRLVRQVGGRDHVEPEIKTAQRLQDGRYQLTSPGWEHNAPLRPDQVRLVQQ